MFVLRFLQVPAGPKHVQSQKISLKARPGDTPIVVATPK